MAKSAASVMMRLGLVTPEMIPQRSVSGIYRVALSVVAVAFSYFFIHVSFFGPPVHQIFKGTFLLGVIILSILLYKGRQRPLVLADAASGTCAKRNGASEPSR